MSVDGSGRSRAVRDAFLSGAAAKVLSLGAQFAALGIAARALPAAPLGILVTLTALQGILGFLDLGIGNASIASFARLHGAGCAGELRVAVGRALATMSALAGVLAVVSLGTMAVLGRGEVGVAVLLFLLISAAAIPASIGSRLALATQRGRQNNVVVAFTSVVVLVGASVAAMSAAGLPAFVAIFTGLPVLGGAVQTVLLLTRSVRPDWTGLTLRSMAAIIVPGLPFTGLALAGAAAYQTDSLIVIAVLGAPAAVGFGLLARIFNGLTVLFMSGLQQLWASTAHALADGDIRWVRRTFKRTVVTTVALYLGADVLLLATGPWIISLWSNGRSSVGIPLVLAFVLWNTYNFAMSQCSMLLNGAGIVGRQAVVSIIMAVVNVPLSLVLTMWWGVSGPLWASLVAHAFIIGVPTIIWIRRLLHAGSAPEASMSAGRGRPRLAHSSSRRGTAPASVDF